MRRFVDGIDRGQQPWHCHRNSLAEFTFRIGSSGFGRRKDLNALCGRAEAAAV